MELFYIIIFYLCLVISTLIRIYNSRFTVELYEYIKVHKLKVLIIILLGAIIIVSIYLLCLKYHIPLYEP